MWQEPCVATELDRFVRRLWETPDLRINSSSPGTPLLGVSRGGHSLITTPGPGITRALLAYQGLRLPRARARRVALAGALGVMRPRPMWWLAGSAEPLHRTLARAAGLPRDRVLVVPRQDDGHYKPSLTFFDDRGGITGFAKLSWHTSTHERLATEAAALRLLSGSVGEGVAAPRLLAETVVGDHPVVVTGPLPADIRQHPRQLPPDAVLREIAGPVETVAWSETRLFNELGLAAYRAANRGDRQRATVLRDGVEWAAARWAAGIPAGRVHGDLVPWNLAVDRVGTVHVWDWEHFASVDPFGLDAAHWEVLVSTVNRGLDWGEALDGVARQWDHPGGSTLRGRDVATLCGLELLARSESLRTADGTEPYPIDRQVMALVRTVEETT